MITIYAYVYLQEDGQYDRYKAVNINELFRIFIKHYELIKNNGMTITNGSEDLLLDLGKNLTIKYGVSLKNRNEKTIMELFVRHMALGLDELNKLYPEIKRPIKPRVEGNMAILENVIDSSGAGYYLGSICCDLDTHMFFPEHYGRDTGYYYNEEDVKKDYPDAITYSEGFEILKKFYSENRY